MKHNFLKTQVIVNPASNRGQTGHRWAEIKTVLKHFLKDFKYDFTERPFQAIDLARDAIKNGADLLIGVGGDGTANEIANGFFEQQKVINPEATLGLIPSGTGCDFTRSLNIPRNLKNAVKFISEAPEQSIDVGRITYQDENGQPTSRYFLNIADFGLGGEVVRQVNSRRLERRASSYILCLLNAMRTYTGQQVSLTADDHQAASGHYLIGAIANGRIFGKGLKIAPKARLNDGLFDLILVKSLSFLEFCLHGWQLANGSHLNYHKVTWGRGQKIEVFPLSPEPVLIEIDGEQVGRLPAAFEIVPSSLQVKGFLK
ncbi:MAG TPA: diacylglycerol kinase family lipid kinase [Candidatus Saccharicenans sp.]|jgi:YegS/Rv2252/BmrU family lipid kinase|nr:diacylglycerol kinase family lipid kinase [Candidatus Saccharicenans sp.]HRD01096.1 diacylglycerol kinase family lipid kinase [Candidatus Saccharicenans sp.]